MLITEKIDKLINEYHVKRGKLPSVILLTLQSTYKFQKESLKSINPKQTKGMKINPLEYKGIPVRTLYDTITQCRDEAL